MRNRLVTGILIVALIGVGIWGYSQNLARQRLQTMLWNQYTRSFYDLIHQVETAHAFLGKSLVSASADHRVFLLSNVSRAAHMAQQDLSQMPLAQGTLLRTSKFLTQLGDFAQVSSRKAALKEALSGADKSKASELYREARTLVGALSRLEATAVKGELRWPELRRGSTTTLREKSKELVDDGFQRIAVQMQEYPSLIYDGPFSDHIQQKEPLGVTGSPVGLDQARGRVREFLPIPESQKAGLTIDNVGDGRGKIPTYGFRSTYSPPGARVPIQITVDVTKKGGHVVWMLNGRPVGKPSLDLAEARRKAQAFLDAAGYKNMTPTYAIAEGGYAVVPFAYVQEGVVIYPDLIKVKVALDNGEVVGFESLGYLMSHRSRAIRKPRITMAQARAKLNPDFAVTEQRLAIIPLETLQEALCYEFRGRVSDEKYAVYIDAITGTERMILRIVDTREGSKTI